MDDLGPLIASWPAEQSAIGVTNAHQTLGLGGDPLLTVGVASISKCVAGFAALVALEEGTITLDDAAGPAGSTVRHLLSHASGLAFDEPTTTGQPGQRRIYSNVGIEQFADYLSAQAGMAFVDYQRLAVLEPLGMTSSVLRGSPAHGLETNVTDLLRFGRELLRPTLIDPSTLDLATQPQFPELRGVVPGIGSFDPNPWGLTFELRSNKSPHWTSPKNSTATFGHFGGSGSFLWVDPTLGLAACALGTKDFGPWALEAWPPASDAIIERFG